VSLIEFWNTIHDNGQLLVDPPTGAPSDKGDEPALCEAIEQVEAQWRLDLAHEPPTLILPVALWSIGTMYRGCQCLVYREMDPEMVAAALATESPLPPDTPDACYSADLGLRVLPDVLALARAASPDDPLVQGLREIGRRWPLSSVGVEPPIDGPLELAGFIDHASLRRLYADRVLARRDSSRASDERVKAEIRAILGAHAQQLTTSTMRTAIYGAQERE
jgi:MoxR-vWA-beta-propeller ternary system domain bpX4